MVMKKLISLMMCVIIISSLLPSQMVLVATAAKSGVCGDNLTWNLDSAGTLTINGAGEMTNYYMIGDWEGNAPWDIDSVKTVIISEGVTSIGDLAFFQCDNLTNITIPDSVTSIGSIAFALCNGLTEITISKGVTDIYPDAFLYCSNLASIFVDEQNEVYMSENGVLFDKSGTTLKHCPNGKTETYTIPDGVTCIGDGAFNGCNKLTEITITDKVTDIGNSAFSSCYILTDVYYDGTQIEWNNINIGTHNDDLLSANIHYADKDVDNVAGYDKCGDNLTWTLDSEGTLTISGTGDMYDYSYGDMPWSEFRDEIHKIEFTDGITSIGETAFYYCSAITNVNIPSDITDIGYDAFRGCEKLEAINVDENNRRYSSVDGVLFDKGKTILMAYPPAKPDPSYEIPNSVIIITLAFDMCNNIKTITIPESVTEIYDGFSCDNLENIVVDEKNTQFSSADGVLFNKNKTMLICYPSGKTNTSYTVPDAVDTIYGSAFYDCISLKNIELPDSVVNMMYGAFYGCENLESIELPNGVTEIAEWTFGYCSSLGNINIPSNITSIGDFAFYNCSNITAFYFDGNAPTIGTETFPNDVILCVPQDASGWTVPTWNGYTTTNSMVTPVSHIELNLADKSMSVGETVTLIATIFPNDATNKDITWTSGNTSVATVDNGIVTAKAIGNTTITATTSNDKRASCEISVTSLVGSCGDDLQWSLDYMGNLMISGNGDMENYDHDNPAPWYSTDRDIKTITLPNGLTSIGNYAFWQCRKVTNIEIPNTVKSIGDSAFNYCENMASIYIPDSVTNIGCDAFWHCDNLSSARIPNNLTNINSGVFSFCDNLTDVTIPNGVTSIGEEAFRGCKSLTNIVIPDSVTVVEARAFSGCENLVNIKFSKNMDVINAHTFSACSSLTEITIPDNIVGIGDGAFSACNSLTSVKIHSNVRGIDSEAFRSCENLISIDVDVDNPYYIVVNGMLLYRDMSGLVLCPAGLSEVIIPNGVEYIQSRAFFDCKKLNSITIPNSIKEIEYSTFYGCDNITKVLYQGSYEEWKNVSIDSSDIVIIGTNIQYNYDESDYATYGTCGKNLTWSLNADGVLKIDGTGNMCDYESIYSDNGLYAKIAPWFFDANIIKSIEMSNGVTNIGNLSFCGSTNLTTIALPCILTKIGNDAFSSCKELTSVEIPNSVTDIGSSAFSYCEKITSISLPDGLLHIGEYAFYDCINLSNIIIPNSVTDIGIGAFGNCEKITTINLPTNIQNISASLFSGCSGLTEIIIPESVTSIGGRAFQDCSSLTEIIIPDNVNEIGIYAFMGCENISSIAIPNGITAFGEYTFGGCHRLKTIIIPKSVTTIAKYAFRNCYALTDVYYSGTEDDWDNIHIDSYDNERLLYATKHYNYIEKLEPPETENTTKSNNGVLRSGDGWSMNWECTYNEDNEGNISKAEVTIQMTGSGDEGDLYVFNGSGGNFPWEEAPYNIPKTAIEKLTIKGHSNVSLRVATNSFKGYNNLKTFIGAYLSGVDSNAFEGCSSLEKVAIAYPKDNFSYGANSFKDCSKLNDVTFSQKLWHIGDGAFENTKLGTITLYDNINNIGDNAFAGCSSLKIKCYKDSVAHQYAVANSIPFELFAQIKYHDFSQNSYIETYDYDLEHYISNVNSSTYNPSLAHIMMGLAASAYKKDDITYSLENMGFSYISTYGHDNAESLIDYSFGQKQMKDGRNLVVIAISGTKGEPPFSTQWGSNLTLGAPLDGGYHDGFDEAYNLVYRDLWTYLYYVYSFDYDISDTVFVITGHSRGAATSNLLAVELSNYGVPQENMYCYSFACPDVSRESSDKWNPQGRYNNIFNVGYIKDAVSLIPGGVMDALWCNGIETWGKFGRNFWFSFDWSNLNNLNITFDDFISNHDPELYMQYLRQKYSLNKYKTWSEVENLAIELINHSNLSISENGTAIYVGCPVDVIVTDELDNIIASVEGGVANYHNSKFGDVVILTDTEQKWIYVQGNQTLNVELTATGAGTMTYSVASVGSNLGANVSEKTFENVALTTGKEMKSEIKATEEVSVPNMTDISLYVVDNEGDIVKEVLPDGAGTEVELKTITFDANGGSVSAATAKTNAGGKLIDLPTPTRSNYTFDGWYDNANGGTKITTDTIFTQDTTIYAHWTKSSSGISTGGGGGVAVSEYTIKFETNGGNTIESVKVSRNSIVIEPTTPTKENCDFEGWYINKELTEKYDFTSKVTKNFTLYAKWAEKADDLAEWKNPFSDINTKDWYYEAVKFANENGLMNGVSETEFTPNLEATRGMFVTILYRLEQEPAVSNLNFTDVASDEYYADAIAWASANGIVSGISNTEFAPNDNITREQMATILFRYATYKGMDAATLGENLGEFVDNIKISDYAISALNWAVGANIITGKGNGMLDPLGNATRAEIATILMRFIEK